MFSDEACREKPYSVFHNRRSQKATLQKFRYGFRIIPNDQAWRDAGRESLAETKKKETEKGSHLYFSDSLIVRLKIITVFEGSNSSNIHILILYHRMFRESLAGMIYNQYIQLNAL